jgi:hypothetical protein
MGLVVGTLSWPKTNDDKIHEKYISYLAKKYSLTDEPQQGEYHGANRTHCTYGIGGPWLMWYTDVKKRIKLFLNDGSNYLKKIGITNVKTTLIKLPM